MWTTITIDGELMAAALKASGLATKREVVEMALQMLVTLRNQVAIRAFRGKLQWSGDLARSRRGR